MTHHNAEVRDDFGKRGLLCRSIHALFQLSDQEICSGSIFFPFDSTTKKTDGLMHLSAHRHLNYIWSFLNHLHGNFLVF